MQVVGFMVYLTTFDVVHAAKVKYFVGVIFVCLVIPKYLNCALLYYFIVCRADSWYSIVVLFLFSCT
jgi:hypothetical protein